MGARVEQPILVTSVDNSETETVLRFTGALTFASNGIAREAVDRAMAVRGDRPVVCDVAGVGYVDSTGLGLLVLLKEAACPDKPLQVRGANDQLRKLIDLTDLDRMISLT